MISTGYIRRSTKLRAGDRSIVQSQPRMSVGEPIRVVMLRFQSLRTVPAANYCRTTAVIQRSCHHFAVAGTGMEFTEVVGGPGFEPGASRSRTVRAAKLRQPPTRPELRLRRTR